MLRQSSSRNYRSRKLRPAHTFQAFLFFAVGIWIVYQLAHGKQRAVVVETEGGDEVPRRRLGRKGFVVGVEGHASSDDDDIVGVGSDHVVTSHGAASSDDDPLSEEEDQAADEDDGVDDEEDILDGEEDDGVDGDTEVGLKTLFGESDRDTVLDNGEDGGARLHEPKELNGSVVPLTTSTGNVQDAAATQHINATDGAVDGTTSAAALGGSWLKNASSVNLSLLDSGTAGEASKKLMVNGSFPSRAAGVGAKDESTMSQSKVMV